MGETVTPADPLTTDDMPKAEFTCKDKKPCERYAPFAQYKPAPKSFEGAGKPCPCLGKCATIECKNRTACKVDSYFRWVPIEKGNKQSNKEFEGKSSAVVESLDGEIREDIEKYKKEAKKYADAIKTNRNFTWKESFGKLSYDRKRAIRRTAILRGFLPNIKILKYKGIKYGFPIFSEVFITGEESKSPVILETLYLPEEKWGSTDDDQFNFLNKVSKIDEKTRGLSTWHHTQYCGMMQLVQRGIHNIITHNGGRTSGLWAKGSRHGKKEPKDQI